MDQYLRALEAIRDEAAAARRAIVHRVQLEGRQELDDVETRSFNQLTGAVERAETRISEWRALERRNERETTVATSAWDNTVVEPATYTKAAALAGVEHRRSYMCDLINASVPGRDIGGEAGERLRRHAIDVRTLPEYQEYRDIDRTDGTGGYGVPPAWLMDQYVMLARPGRATANVVTNQALPAGTDSINLPK